MAADVCSFFRKARIDHNCHGLREESEENESQDFSPQSSAEYNDFQKVGNIDCVNSHQAQQTTLFKHALHSWRYTVTLCFRLI